MLAGFLKRSRSHWYEFWDDLRLRLTPVAPADLPIARFIYQKRHFTTVVEDGVRRPVAKAKAFEPPKNGKLSTMHTRELDRDVLWEIDPRRPGQVALAAAHIVAEHAISQRLDVRMDDRLNDRPERHVTIRGWPPNTTDEKHERMAVMLYLANAAEIQLPNH